MEKFTFNEWLDLEVKAAKNRVKLFIDLRYKISIAEINVRVLRAYKVSSIHRYLSAEKFVGLIKDYAIIEGRAMIRPIQVPQHIEINVDFAAAEKTILESLVIPAKFV